MVNRENSGSFPEPQDPQWFVVKGSSWVGPMTVGEVLEKIESGELTWADFAWREGEGGWMRLCDLPDFQIATPARPRLDPKEISRGLDQAGRPAAGKQRSGPPPVPRDDDAKVPPPVPQADRPAPPVPKEWFLYYNDSQFGPFSRPEVERYISIGKIHGRVYAWKDGLDNWQRLETLKEFTSALEDSSKRPGGGITGTVSRAAKARIEQRGSPRRPLVARILLTDDQRVIVGVCRDISIGGMQVLTERVPGEPGMRLKFNVSPPVKDTSVPPFVTQGVIVRILEDGRGFSFRFEDLSAQARRAIEDYIATSG